MIVLYASNGASFLRFSGSLEVGSLNIDELTADMYAILCLRSQFGDCYAHRHARLSATSFNESYCLTYNDNPDPILGGVGVMIADNTVNIDTTRSVFRGVYGSVEGHGYDGTAPMWVGVRFFSPKLVDALVFYVGLSSRPDAIVVQGSFDGASWETLHEESDLVGGDKYDSWAVSPRDADGFLQDPVEVACFYCSFVNSTRYSWYRIVAGGTGAAYIAELALYGSV